MRELGEVLRKRREQLGMSLDDVQAATKIRKRYLQALEDGDWSVLPGEVYARGFVRTYAEHLGLDGHALLAQFTPAADQEKRERERSIPPNPSQVDVSPEARVPRAGAEGTGRPARVRRKPAASKDSGWQKFWNEYGMQAAAVVVVLLVLGGGWYWLSHAGGGPSGTDNHTVATAPGAQAGNHASGGSDNTVSSNNTTPPVAAPGNNTTDHPGTSNTTTVTAQPRRGSVQSYVVQTSAATFEVNLTAQNGNCWVAVKVDGRSVDPNDMVYQGQSRTWQGAETVDIQAGDAAVIRVLVNGQAVEVPPVAGPLHLKFVRGS